MREEGGKPSSQVFHSSRLQPCPGPCRHQTPMRTFTETLGKAANPAPHPILDPGPVMATAEKGCGGRGICEETWGLDLTRREVGESVQASPTPHCLTEQAVSLPYLFLVRTGRKGSLGAKSPAPAPTASTISRDVGYRGSPKSAPQEGGTVLPPICQHRP